MTDRLETATETHRAIGRSRLRHTWDYRARCAHCDQPKLTKHALETRQLVCSECSYVYPRNSFATAALNCLCDGCGFAAILFRCGQARLCAICAKRWDDGGRKQTQCPRVPGCRTATKAVTAA